MRKLTWILGLAAVVAAGCGVGQISRDDQLNRYEENKKEAEKLAAERGEVAPPQEGQGGN
ncbi:MAG: hypothetical protein QY327_10040 [Fimbriimonadaceae bacterium]|nr:MAG: hypothetical protein QY327_10040 [Fimbriimonadaceae bacterium]